MTSREKMANVYGRLLQSILQSKGVHDKHRIIEVELLNGIPIRCDNIRKNL